MNCPDCVKLLQALARIRSEVEVPAKGVATRVHKIADAAIFDYGQRAGREILNTALPDHPTFGCHDPNCKFHR